jgi:hypothetical protein
MQWNVFDIKPDQNSFIKTKELYMKTMEKLNIMLDDSADDKVN